MRIQYDPLRPPWPLDPEAAAYKDWLHLNLFDHATGCVGLVNLSLHGAPSDPRSRAMGTALVHRPGNGWTGNTIVRGMHEAQIGATSILLDQVALGVNHAAGLILAAATLPHDGLELDLAATAETPASDIGARIPLNDGWISWYFVPRLAVRGEIKASGECWQLDGASAYHDHNWGRWHWGSDFGWEWGAFLAPETGPTFVVTRLTDRAHQRNERALLEIRAGEQCRSFAGPTLSVELRGDLNIRLRRLPGALAALHGDQSQRRLPAQVRITADDGHDHVSIEFVPDGAVQLIAGDPLERGYGFIQEMSGRFTCTGEIGGSRLSAEGLGIFEYVD